MQKPASFHTDSIDLAFANKDHKTVILAYLDVLDYSKAGFKAEHLIKVFESLNYEVSIDHALVEHLGRTAGKLGFAQEPNIKMH